MWDSLSEELGVRLHFLYGVAACGLLDWMYTILGTVESGLEGVFVNKVALTQLQAILPSILRG